MLPSELDSFLDVTWRPSVDSNYWNVPLLTWKPKRCVEVAALDGPIGKRVRLEVGVFGGTRLIRTPYTVVPGGTDPEAIPRGRVVTRGGRWGRADERLRDF